MAAAPAPAAAAGPAPPPWLKLSGAKRVAAEMRGLQKSVAAGLLPGVHKVRAGPQMQRRRHASRHPPPAVRTSGHPPPRRAMQVYNVEDEAMVWRLQVAKFDEEPRSPDDPGRQLK